LKPVRPVYDRFRFRFRLDPRPVPVPVSVFKTMVGRHKASYEYQLPPTHRWTDRDRQQMGGGVSEKLCGREATHMGEYCYNITYHMSIRMSPFRALYGYDAPSFVETVFGNSRVPRAQGWVEESQRILQAVRENLQTAQNQQKIYAGKQKSSTILR
jgi:hypothetical protein